MSKLHTLNATKSNSFFDIVKMWNFNDSILIPSTSIPMGFIENDASVPSLLVVELKYFFSFSSSISSKLSTPFPLLLKTGLKQELTLSGQDVLALYRKVFPTVVLDVVKWHRFPLKSVCLSAVCVLFMSMTNEDDVDSDDRMKAIGLFVCVSIAGMANRASKIGFSPAS